MTVKMDSTALVASHESDLWCTYAAVRTLKWLGRLQTIDSPEDVAASMRNRRNSDGGYAWMTGMNSDAWATYYCTQTLHDLAHEFPDLAPPTDRTGADWVLRLQNDDGGFAMTPGQRSDVWATYYATRTLREVFDTSPPSSVLEWLSDLQGDDGGLDWSPAHTPLHPADVRACYYGTTAWNASTTAPTPWDRERLLNWLQHQQSPSGGFRFQSSDSTDCMWATYRATSTLRQLSSQPHDANLCIKWIHSQLVDGESFTRWPGYTTQDVWAAFCAIGALRELGADVSSLADQVANVLNEFRLPGGGYTYRQPDLAFDALTTSAKALTFEDTQSRAAQDWLESCQLPNEDGIMYMPGRGSEVRCTLWALAAGAFQEDSEAMTRIAQWLTRSIRNPDGGFGFWEGRGSDLVSTSAATEILRRTGKLSSDVKAGLESYVASCQTEPDAFSNVPGGEPTLRATLQALRIQNALGRETCRSVESALERHRVRGGGFANEGHRLPDLLTTYEAVLTADRLMLPIDSDHITRFLNSIHSGNCNYGWTPLAPGSGGPLADCFGSQLARRVNQSDHPLPPLVVS